MIIIILRVAFARSGAGVNACAACVFFLRFRKGGVYAGKSGVCAGENSFLRREKWGGGK